MPTARMTIRAGRRGPRRTGLATIYDVAKRAGVSAKTVSRVLNGDGPVSAGTQEAVVEAMEALGYVPSLAARSIKSRKSGLVGLITGAISTATERTRELLGLPDLFIVQGIQQVLQGSDKTLLIADTGGSLEQVPGLIRTFRQHRVEGLLYVADFHKRVDIPLRAGDARTVLVNCYDDEGTPAVVPDDEAGQLAVTRQIVAAGHRRIGYLSLGTAAVATTLRLRGFERALTEAGVPLDPDLVVPVELRGGIGEHQLIWDAVDRFLKHARPPTAICCGNDRLAMTVYGILRERGMSLPDGMSIVGYDDHRSISESLYPPLTTVELPYYAMGARAAQLLLDMIDTPDRPLPTEPVRVGGSVRYRDSLVPPADAGSAVINLDRRSTS